MSTLYTKRTAHLLVRAQEEVQRRHHLYVGPEHLLLGLLSENGGLTPRIFKDLRIDIQEMYQAIETTLNKQEQHIGPIKRIRMHLPTLIKLGRLLSPPRKRFNRRAEMVLARAREATQTLNHRYIGTEHILLGLTAKDGGAISELLISKGLNEEAVRNEIVRLLL